MDPEGADPGAGAPQAQPWTPPRQPDAGGYPPPQPYFGFAPPRSSRNGLSTGSLVLGIVALLASWIPFGGLILGVCALAIGVAAGRRVKRGEADNSGAAIAGIVLGIVATIIGGLTSIFAVYLIVRYQYCITHATNRYEYGQC